MSLSENIKKYRLEKGYTQEQLGAALGLSAQAVSKWETSETYPDGALLVPLANTLGVSLDTLFGNRSVSVNEISEQIKELVSSVAGGNEFHTVRELCWQIEKALFNRGMPIDDPYDPEELKRQALSSYHLNDSGFTYVSNGRAPFFTVVPEYGNALSEVIGDGEEMRKIFAALSSPDSMRAVLFIHQNKERYVFEKEVLADACGIEEDRIDQVMDDLITLRLVDACKVEIDEESKWLFYSIPSHLLITLLLLTHELNYHGGYCYQSHYRIKPFLAK